MNDSKTRQGVAAAFDRSGCTGGANFDLRDQVQCNTQKSPLEKLPQAYSVC